MDSKNDEEFFFQSNQRLRPLKAFEGRPGLTKMQQMSLKNLGTELWNAFFLQHKVPPWENWLKFCLGHKNLRRNEKVCKYTKEEICFCSAQRVS